MAVLRYCLLALALVLAVQCYPTKGNPEAMKKLVQLRQEFLDKFADARKEAGFSWSKFEDAYVFFAVKVAKESGDFRKDEIKIMRNYFHAIFKMMKNEDYEAFTDFVASVDYDLLQTVVGKMTEDFYAKMYSKLNERISNDE